MGRGHNVLWCGSAREAALLSAAAVMLAACRDEVPSMEVDRRVPLAEAGDVETLAPAADGGVWLGLPGRLVRVDSLGRPAAEVLLPGGAAQVLGGAGARLVLQQGADLVVADVDSGVARARRAPQRSAPAAVDPRGRWVYTSHAWGSVLGLDSALVPRWGWPDVGARATALAVGPLGDRVYLGVEEGEDSAPGVYVLEAWTGRVLGVWESPHAPAGLVAGPDPARLYAWDAGGVVALGHAPGSGLEQHWRASLGRLRMDSVRVVRPSPDGSRVAVLGRHDGEVRVAVLQAATGRDTLGWNGSPPDVVWDGRGRLVAPSEGALLWLR